MLKNKIKKLLAAGCAAAMSLQLMVMPAKAAVNIPEALPTKVNPVSKFEDVTLTSKSTVLAETNASYTGSTQGYTFSFDFTMNTRLANCADAGNGRDRSSFYIELDSSNKKAGGVMHALQYNASNDSMTFQWRTANTQSLSGSLKVGVPYKIVMDVKSTNLIDLNAYEILDETTGELSSVSSLSGSNLGMRNVFATKSPMADTVRVWMNSYEQGEEASVSIKNMAVTVSGANQMEVKVGGKESKPATETSEAVPAVVTFDAVKGVNTFDVSAQAMYNGIALTYDYNIELSSEYKEITLEDVLDENGDVTGKRLAVAPGLAEGGEYPVSLTVYIADYKTQTEMSYPVTVKVPEPDVNAIAAANVKEIDITKKKVVERVGTDDVYTVSGDFEVPVSAGATKCGWTAVQKLKTDADEADAWKETEFVSADNSGNVKVYPTSSISEYDVKLICTGTYTSASGNTGTAVREFVLNLFDPTEAVKRNIERADAVNEVVCADDVKLTENKRVFDLTGTDSLHYDLVLPTEDTMKMEEVKLSWASDSDKLKIADGVAQINVSDKNEHKANLTYKVSYVKDGKTLAEETKVYPITIKFDDEVLSGGNAELLGKYQVRFDISYADNFKDIPSSTSSNITLPTKGYFGSKIAWSSSAPNVISTSGVVTRASSDKTVTLTATVSSGAFLDETYKKNVFVYGTSGSGSSGSGWGSGGSSGSSGSGSGSTSSGVFNTPMPIPTPVTTADPNKPTPVPEPVNFGDLDDVEWAKEAINGLAEKGIINGRSSTVFAPNDSITRAEFAKIIVGAFKIPASGAQVSFNDVEADAWYASYINAAYAKGIITGYENGSFDPNAQVTRQDMAVMVQRAANASGVVLADVNPAVNFDDDYAIADYAKAAVKALSQAGIINGVTQNSFAPLETATRAQAAKILYNFCR